MMYSNSNCNIQDEYTCIGDNYLYESINTNKINSNEYEIRGILKNNNENFCDIYYNSKIIDNILQFLLCMIIIPFMFCDLYFGTENNICLDTYPHNFNLNMRIFLFVSGSFELFILSYNILKYCFDFHYKYIILQLLNKIFIIITSITYLIWNIIGIFIFGSIIYNKSICENLLYNYLIIAIIIKIIINFIIIIKNK